MFLFSYFDCERKNNLYIYVLTRFYMNSSSNVRILGVASTSTSAVDFPDNKSNAFLKHAGRITDIYSNNLMQKEFSQILKNAMSTVSQETEVRSRDGQTSTTLINQKNKDAYSDQKPSRKLTLEENKKLLTYLMGSCSKTKVAGRLCVQRGTLDNGLCEIEEKLPRFKELFKKLISNNSLGGFRFRNDVRKGCDRIVTEWWNSNKPEDTSRKQDQDDKNTDNPETIKKKILEMFEQELVAKRVSGNHKRKQMNENMSYKQEIRPIVQNKNMTDIEKAAELYKRGVTHYWISVILNCDNKSVNTKLNNYIKEHPDDTWLGEMSLYLRQIIQRYSEKGHSLNKIANIYQIPVDYVEKSLQYRIWNLKKLIRVNLPLKTMEGMCEDFFIRCERIGRVRGNAGIQSNAFGNVIDTLALNSKLLAPLTEKIRQLHRIKAPIIVIKSVKRKWYTSYFSKDKPITTDIPMDTIDEKIKELIPIACNKIYQTEKEHDVKSSGSNPRKRLSDLSMSNRDDSGSPKKSRVIDDAEGAPTLFDQSKPIQIEYASGVVAESSLEKYVGLGMSDRDDSTPQNRSVINYAKSASTLLSQGNLIQAGYAYGVVAESSLEKYVDLGMSNRDDSTPQNRTGTDRSEKNDQISYEKAEEIICLHKKFKFSAEYIANRFKISKSEVQGILDAKTRYDVNSTDHTA